MWSQGENTMRFRKETIEYRVANSTNLSKKKQVVVSRLRKGYTQVTHRHVIEKTPSPECSFCGATKNILWKCTETKRKENGTTKEVLTDGTEGLKRLIRK
jgi:hypothetical protein